MIFSALLDLFFPRRCVACGTLGAYLCPRCFSIARIIEHQVCPVCERPAVGGATHPRCQSRSSLDGLTSICVYEGPVKAAIHRLKYRPWTADLGELLAKIIVKQGDWRFLAKDREMWMAVPVPLHPSRQRERGFNQSEILGRLFAHRLDLKFYPDLLVRVRKTKPQAELKGKEREQNIKEAFKIDPNSQFLIHNSQVLLIDDIWTTGATLKTCGQVLKKAGFGKVWALTLAR